jgi:hypothetical protein
MAMSAVSTPAGPALDLQIYVNPMADDAAWHLELSSDLTPTGWAVVPATMVSEVRQPDGRSLQTWRISDAAALGGNRKFARVNVELR